MADDQQNLNAVRLMQLEERLEELNSRVGNLVGQVATLSRRVAELEGREAGQAAPVMPFGLDAAVVGELSPGMQHVVELIQSGQGEAAQVALYDLPENELSQQPVAVALVAAALFIQRGDVAAGLKALRQANQLVEDPRLAAVVERLESQV